MAMAMAMAMATAMATAATATTTAALHAAVGHAAVGHAVAAAACGTAACTSAGMSNGNMSCDATPGPFVATAAVTGIRVPRIRAMVPGIRAMEPGIRAMEPGRSRGAMAASGGGPMAMDRPPRTTRGRRGRRCRWAMVLNRTAMRAAMGTRSNPGRQLTRLLDTHAIAPLAIAKTAKPGA